MFKNNKKLLEFNFELFFLSKDGQKLSEIFKISEEKVFIEIKNSISEISKIYSGFNDWYDNKVVPEVTSSSGREIVVLVIKTNGNPQIVGVAITKDTLQEKKICTINVNKKYRKLGISNLLFETCFNILKTRKPFFTVSREHYEAFKPIIKKFNFNVTSIKCNVYENGDEEYFINGKTKLT